MGQVDHVPAGERDGALRERARRRPARRGAGQQVLIAGASKETGRRGTDAKPSWDVAPGQTRSDSGLDRGRPAGRQADAQTHDTGLPARAPPPGPRGPRYLWNFCWNASAWAGSLNLAMALRCWGSICKLWGEKTTRHGPAAGADTTTGNPGPGRLSPWHSAPLPRRQSEAPPGQGTPPGRTRTPSAATGPLPLDLPRGPRPGGGGWLWREPRL